MSKILFLLTLFTPWITFAEVAEEAPANLAVSAVPRDFGAWTQRQRSFNETAAKGEAKLIFLGDSITQGWENVPDIWNAKWSAYQAANFGMGGDRTENVLWRARNGNFDGIKPKLVVLMIGTNNTRNSGDRFPEHGNAVYQSPPENTAAGVKEIIAEIGRKSPKTRILLLAIFPRGKGADDPLRVKNEETNRLLAQMADRRRVFFMNINKKFLQPDGVLSPEIAPDLLHLSRRGYEIWAEAIEGTVKRLMAM